MNEQYIIIVGNPCDGFVHWGPYATNMEANEFAEKHFDGEEWWVADLWVPTAEDLKRQADWSSP